MKRVFSSSRMIVLTAGLLLSLAMTGTVLADSDHDRARRLSESGEIMPLEQLLKKVEGYGRVLEVELKSRHGRHVYEIEFLDPDGDVRESYFDARSGEPLSEPGKDD